MWFLFSILTALAWGGADLFYKKGSDSNDKYSHLKIVVIVGLVMGLHATGYMLYKDIDFKPFDMVKYLPVSFFYIASMTALFGTFDFFSSAKLFRCYYRHFTIYLLSARYRLDPYSRRYHHYIWCNGNRYRREARRT